MADLHLHAVQWCAQHGHPVLSLRTADDRFFVVAIAAEDAGALAAAPKAAGAERSPRRQYGLIETMLATLGARLTEIRLHVGGDHLLRASLRVRGAQGEFTLPACFADGIALAHRGRLPLRMAEEDLARVPLAPLFPVASHEEGAAPPEAFRALIESLDLEGLGGEADGPHPRGA
jgi:bifunctional DNase/RNase